MRRMCFLLKPKIHYTIHSFHSTGQYFNVSYQLKNLQTNTTPPLLSTELWILSKLLHHTYMYVVKCRCLATCRRHLFAFAGLKINSPCISVPQMEEEEEDVAKGGNAFHEQIIGCSFSMALQNGWYLFYKNIAFVVCQHLALLFMLSLLSRVYVDATKRRVWIHVIIYSHAF